MLVPIDVLTQVFRPRISQAYADGEEHGLRLWRIMAVGLGGCGVLAGAGLFTAAYFLPRVAPGLIKSEFADARIALMYLSFVPPLYGLQRANVVSAIARGAVGAYAAAIAMGALFGIGTLVTLAPTHGWRGACIASQVYLAVSCLTTWLFSRNVLTIRAVANAPVIDVESPENAPLVSELGSATL
jgi:O-antigen/teichoic acid export membrane protein